MNWLTHHRPAVAVATLLFAAAPLPSQERFNATVRATQMVKPRIVGIQTKKTVEGGGLANSYGSGVIFDPAGYLVTNYHVIEGATEVKVSVYVDPSAENEKQRYKDFDGRILAMKPDADLAIVKIIPDQPGRLFPFMPLFGAGEALEGETVIAIGNPFGIGISISNGIVSAKDRAMVLPHGVLVEGLVQTSAPINPGNSGGALVNIDGDLLGINTAIRQNAQGIGFALPTRMVVKTIDELMGEPAIPLSRLGVRVQEKVSGDAVQRGGLAQSVVLISDVAPDSEAAKFRLHSGDELLEMNGQRVGVKLDVSRSLWGRQPGDPVRMRVRRDEQEFQLTLNLPRKAATADERIWQKLGVWVKPVKADRVSVVNANHNTKYETGVVICAMNPQAADKLPWQVGDVLVQLDQYALRSAADLAFVSDSAELAGKRVGCPLLRGATFYKDAWVNLPVREAPAAPVAVR